MTAAAAAAAAHDVSALGVCVCTGDAECCSAAATSTGQRMRGVLEFSLWGRRVRGKWSRRDEREWQRGGSVATEANRGGAATTSGGRAGRAARQIRHSLTRTGASHPSAQGGRQRRPLHRITDTVAVRLQWVAFPQHYRLVIPSHVMCRRAHKSSVSSRCDVSVPAWCRSADDTSEASAAQECKAHRHALQTKILVTIASYKSSSGRFIQSIIISFSPIFHPPLSPHRGQETLFCLFNGFTGVACRGTSLVPVLRLLPRAGANCDRESNYRNLATGSPDKKVGRPDPKTEQYR